jgi:hypothetical protein
VKCIKERCKYYQTHQTHEGLMICTLIGNPMKRNYENICDIEKEFEIAKRRFLILQTDFEWVKDINIMKHDTVKET